MTRDEFIGKLQMIYVGENNAIDEIIAEYDRLNKRNKELEDGFKAVNEELCEYAEKVDKAIDYINKHKIEYIDHKFEEFNVMVEFNEYANPQYLLDILKGEENGNS